MRKKEKTLRSKEGILLLFSSLDILEGRFSSGKDVGRDSAPGRSASISLISLPLVECILSRKCRLGKCIVMGVEEREGRELDRSPLLMMTNDRFRMQGERR
jgi:hypothetical protein